MNMNLLKLSFVVFILVFTSCNTKKKATDTKAKKIVIDEHSSMNSLDWNGTYEGILPCADCAGIQSILTLNNDLTYTLQSKYLEKQDTVFTNSGTFTWSENGQQVTLDNKASEQYFVGENNLLKLDLKGEKITGDLADHYKFNKQQMKLADRHWKLVELRGQKVSYEKKKGNQPYLILRPNEENKAYGNTGCNRFTGTFELREGNQITFSQMAATKMYCSSSMETEKIFLEVLNTADNYSLNGETMTLNKGKMAPLAKFEVAYFQ
tara:strand:- start:489895 stop:490689 length:795 start_codon:yes stop_codon:yes gene_type:complete